MMERELRPTLSPSENRSVPVGAAVGRPVPTVESQAAVDESSTTDDERADEGAAGSSTPDASVNAEVRYGTSSTLFANGAANRSPTRVRQQLVPRDEAVALEQAPLAIDSSDVDCWDQRGGARWVPGWAPKLLARFGRKHFGALRNATLADPWLILIGWVPTRFMGPQKPGRKANGDVFEAPTRGRDPQFYLNEYNASWHAAVSSGGLEHHFQIVHRNAMAVCVRERLHLTQLFCAAKGFGDPVQIYYCPCRKCREATAKTTKTPLADAFPRFALPRLHNVTWDLRPAPRRKGKPPMAFNETCIQARSAPWLAALADVAFGYEGLQNDLGQLLLQQADAEKIVVVVIFNKFWIDHLHNFVFSLVRRARLANFIVATMDAEALQLCVANRLPCFDATAFAELELDMVAGAHGGQKGHVRKVTEEMSWIKPRLAVEVLSRGYNFFMADLDLSWNRNPMQHINVEGTADVVHQCDSPSKFSINSGFFFARSNPRTVQYFQNLQVFRPSENSDQTAMKLFSRYDHTHGATNECLDRWVFNMKCNYKVPGSVKVVRGVETFQWRDFDRDRGKFFWSILHATCLNGAQAKLAYLRTMNAWFLDDLDAMTKATDSCLVLDDGTTVSTKGAVTKHSPKYTLVTDSVYLRDRH